MPESVALFAEMLSCNVSPMRFLLLDRIVALEPPERAVGVKCVTLSDEILRDHFSLSPLFPGSLIIEAMAQLGGALVEEGARRAGREDRLAVLGMVDRARFRRAVKPGDTLRLEARTRAATDDGARVACTAFVGDEPAAEAELGFAFADGSPRELVEERRRVVRLWLSGAAYE